MHRDQESLDYQVATDQFVSSWEAETMALPNDDLLRQAIGGNRDALGTLLEAHGPKIRSGLATRIPQKLRSVLSAADVMQQACVDAFLHIGTFVPQRDGSFSAWLATIAENKLADAIRALVTEKRGGNRHRVEPRATAESFVALYELLGGTTTTPSRKAVQNEARIAIEQAILKLPDDYRRVVQMRDLEGRSLREVAEALNRKPGAAAMLRARAHRRLAEMMGTASRFLSGSV